MTKEIFLIKKDLEYLWYYRDRIQWGSRQSEFLKEFNSFEDAKKVLDNLPLIEYTTGSYFEIQKFYKHKSKRSWNLS